MDIFSCVKSTTPRYHSSFYRVLLSLVVRHFCVSVILNSFIITCVVRHFNCPESKIRGHKFLPCPSVYVRDWDGGISVSQTHLVRFWNPFASVILIFLILLFEWEYVSFMMLSCIFWIGPRNGWVSYLNYAVHIYCKLTLYGYILADYLYAHKSSKDVPCKGIGAWFKTQIVRLDSTLIPTKVSAKIWYTIYLQSMSSRQTVRFDWLFDVWCFNANFNNISAIPWRPVLVVVGAAVPGKKHRPWASNW